MLSEGDNSALFCGPRFRGSESSGSDSESVSCDAGAAAGGTCFVFEVKTLKLELRTLLKSFFKGRGVCLHGAVEGQLSELSRCEVAEDKWHGHEKSG